MKTIEKSLVITMDGCYKERVPFLPYILQYRSEIGAGTYEIIKLIRKYFNNIARLKVLDSGCRKGAVSVKVSKEPGCVCYGIFPAANSPGVTNIKLHANETKLHDKTSYRHIFLLSYPFYQCREN